MSASTPTRDPSARLSPVWWVLRALAVFVVRVTGRWQVHVTGLEQVPAVGSAVLVFNHHSYFDFVMVAWDVVRRLHRPVRFLAKREIWGSRWAGWIVRVAKAVPVDREDATSRVGAFDAAIARLREGDLVAVAPEQTISPSFELLPMRTGAVRMAQGAGVPIIPVVGWGTQRFAAKGHGIRVIRRLPVRVAYGPPIHIDPAADPVEVTQHVQDIMARMLGEVQEQYPDKPRPGDDWWVPARLGGSAPNHDEVVAEHLARFRRRPEGA